jgi:hypothetical protein
VFPGVGIKDNVTNFINVFGIQLNTKGQFGIKQGAVIFVRMAICSNVHLFENELKSFKTAFEHKNLALRSLVNLSFRQPTQNCFLNDRS